MHPYLASTSYDNSLSSGLERAIKYLTLDARCQGKIWQRGQLETLLSSGVVRALLG